MREPWGADNELWSPLEDKWDGQNSRHFPAALTFWVNPGRYVKTECPRWAVLEDGLIHGRGLFGGVDRFLADLYQFSLNTEQVMAQLAASMVAAAESLGRASNVTTQANRPAAPRRGLNRTEAAAYVGVSATTFDGLVKSKGMPAPIRIGSRTIWDIQALDSAFDTLASGGGNPWDAWG